MEKTKKDGRGGYRENSGRKAKYNDPVTIGLTVERAMADAVDNCAKAHGCTRTDIIIAAIRAYLGA